ncbi:hypothetical protein N2605_00270 [Bradyrhizobium yuanmingense]|nr:hypothetical protein [Bradyrhizobium sp. CB1024]UWU88680.1 hypothetical protein N2605_00270 [Bradyrhizobium sp. CB1024]
MGTSTEQIGAADEIAGEPVGQRHLASGRRRVVAANTPLFDQINAVLQIALTPDMLACRQDLLAADGEDTAPVSLTQRIQQARQRPDQSIRSRQHDAGRIPETCR